MIKVGKWIAKHKILILIIAVLLLVPSLIGMAMTRVNYDLLSYLPGSLDTVEGQNILVDEFGMGAYTMIVVEDMDLKDVAKVKEKVEQVDHVTSVLWYDSLLDLSIPVDMLPEEIRDVFFRGNATMMIALLDDSTSADVSMEAISQIRTILNKQCFASGMTSVVLDVKNLTQQEVPIYVGIAAGLSLVVLLLAMDSFLVPILFLLSIGMSILYNLGSNLFLGEISYVTQALTAVLQLGVTMDYSIFLLNSYEDYKIKYPGDKERAMGHAIAATFKSVVGSSITTVAGFIALCFMTFTLGLDMGIVMAKGVVIGVLVCITVLPSMVLVFDKAIEKTTHRSLMPSFDKVSHFITRHYWIWLILFVALLYPAYYGETHYDVYYNIDSTLPKDLPSQVANEKLSDEFDMNTVHMVLLESDVSAKEKIAMMNEIEAVDGVSWALGASSIVGPGFPESMIPDSIKSKLSSENYEIEFICSSYKTATDEMNAQIGEIQEIIDRYSPNSILIGEAPLTKDLINVTAIDFQNVNEASILLIVAIILIVFRSVSLPLILVAVIEFAIFVNMACSYYTGVTLPFVAGIVIGTIQLGATVDYAILMTSRYQKERKNGLGRKEAVSIAHASSMKSIIISGCSFFAATFGVGLYSEIDMISAICTLLARGAVISMVVVILILPAMLLIFDPLIVHTSLGFRPKKKKEKAFKRQELLN